MAILSKVLQDRWSGNRPQVTSFLTLPATPATSLTTIHTFSSPACGFGWGFKISRSFMERESPSDNFKELVGMVDVVFEPRLCKGMGVSPVSISMNVNFSSTAQKCSLRKQLGNISISADRRLGTYEEPSSYYDGKVDFEITLAFNPKDNLSLPTTPPISVNEVLSNALQGKPLNDTKFYLYSARIQGKPGRPSVVYGNSNLLQGNDGYLQRVSNDSESDGIVCDLYEDDERVIDRLKHSSYDYDSDSDLETVLDEDEDEEKDEEEAKIDSDDIVLTTPATEGNGKANEIERASITVPKPRQSRDSVASKQAIDTSSSMLVDIADNGKAFAVCGAAYQTWKAFLYYAYTNEIYFKSLKSAKKAFSTAGKPVEEMACSPKSMFRLASTNPTLRNLAMEAIRTSLSEENIVEELFSYFTSRYEDILNMELDFLLQNLSPKVYADLDRALQLVITGHQPHCQPLLMTIFRRLRGGDAGMAGMGTNEPQKDHSSNDHPLAKSSGISLTVHKAESETRITEKGESRSASSPPHPSPPKNIFEFGLPEPAQVAQSGRTTNTPSVPPFTAGVTSMGGICADAAGPDAVLEQKDTLRPSSKKSKMKKGMKKSSINPVFWE